MTRKHFNAIADSLQDSKPHAGKNTIVMMTWRHTVENMADTVGQFNDYFDRSRFMSACGYNN
jgi:hypothetical protein